jgi:CheY-like chemotaxis protein
LSLPILSSVLLVDDDSTTNYLNKLLLTKTMQVTQQVLIAENGQEALHTLAQTCVAASASCPALILLDLNMPVMNGREFLARYVQLPAAQRQGIVVVLLTTSLHEQDLLAAQQLPIADFLTKPLTRAKLTDLLARHFAQSPE